MNVLLVGCGFIGHHYARALKGAGVTLWIVNRSSIWPERMESLKGVPIGDIELSPADEFVKPDWWPDVFEVVLYAASTSTSGDVDKNFEDGMRGIVNGPRHILQTIECYNFIYLSSSMVYDAHPCPEDETYGIPEHYPLKPQQPYGILKVAGEETVKYYTKQNNIIHNIIRPSAVYGPRDNDRRVLNKWILAAGRGGVIRVDDNYADFTWVEHLADRLAQLTIFWNQIDNSTFNITTGRGRKLSDAADIILDYLPGTAIHKVASKGRGFPTRGALDNTQIEEGVVRHPLMPAPPAPISIEKGIPLLIADLKKRI